MFDCMSMSYIAMWYTNTNGAYGHDTSTGCIVRMYCPMAVWFVLYGIVSPSLWLYMCNVVTCDGIAACCESFTCRLFRLRRVSVLWSAFYLSEGVVLLIDT